MAPATTPLVFDGIVPSAGPDMPEIETGWQDCTSLTIDSDLTALIRRDRGNDSVDDQLEQSFLHVTLRVVRER